MSGFALFGLYTMRLVGLRRVIILAAILFPCAPAATANMISNASFEVQGSTSERARFWELGVPDTNGFLFGSAARVNWRNYPPGAGSWSAALRGTWAGQGSSGYWIRILPISPGGRYRLSGWFWADDGNPHGPWNASAQYFALFFLDATQAWAGGEFTSLAGIGQSWRERVLEAVAPTNAAFMQIYFGAEGVSRDGAITGDK
jgi:hypothetical protein